MSLGFPDALAPWVAQVYGELAPAPAMRSLWLSLRHQHTVAAWQDASHAVWRLDWGPARGDGMLLHLARPALPPSGAQAAMPCPVLISGDACWPYLSAPIVAAALQAGVAVLSFDRTEVHADHPGAKPNPPGRMPALMAWAWAMHRAVDAVQNHLGANARLDVQRVAVHGHSRGGKAALLAAASDPRIALVVANNSGALGAGSSQVLGEGAETVAHLAQQFGHWVAPGLHLLANKPGALVPDQDALLAAILPRQILLTQAEGDAWANPLGTRHVIQRVKQQGAGLRAVWRQGGHAMTQADWQEAIQATAALGRP